MRIQSNHFNQNPNVVTSVRQVNDEMEVDQENRNSGLEAGAGAGGDDAAASPAPVPPAGVKQEGAGGAANGAGAGSSGAGAEAGGAAVNRKARTWTGIAGAERVLVDGVWRVSGGTVGLLPCRSKDLSPEYS